MTDNRRTPPYVSYLVLADAPHAEHAVVAGGDILGLARVGREAVQLGAEVALPTIADRGR
jgi:hypothetical protein